MAALVLVFTTAFLLRETAIAHRSWFMPAVAAAVMGATGALNAFDKLLQLPVAVDLATEVVLTGLSAYLFHMALTAERLRLEREELRREAGGVLILCCALMALARVTIMDVLCLGRVAAVLCVVLAGCLFPWLSPPSRDADEEEEEDAGAPPPEGNGAGHVLPPDNLYQEPNEVPIPHHSKREHPDS